MNFLILSLSKAFNDHIFYQILTPENMRVSETQHISNSTRVHMSSNIFKAFYLPKSCIMSDKESVSLIHQRCYVYRRKIYLQCLDSGRNRGSCLYSLHNNGKTIFVSGYTTNENCYL